MLPFDMYWGNPVWELELRAGQAIIVDCMHHAGYTDERINHGYSAPTPEDVVEGTGSLLGLHKFNEDLAAKYGYRWAPNPQDIVTEGDTKKSWLMTRNIRIHIRTAWKG